jgi:hypothetical protein
MTGRRGAQQRIVPTRNSSRVIPLRAFARLSLLVAAAVSLASVAALAQEPAPPGMSLEQSAARRFPQPVRVGALLDRQVLQPLESQPTLGWVRAVVKRPDGGIAVVMSFGSLLGRVTWPVGALFARLIAVPVEGMALLGQDMVILDFTPKQLSAFPTFDPTGTTPLPSAEFIMVALAKPSH